MRSVFVAPLMLSLCAVSFASGQATKSEAVQQKRVEEKQPEQKETDKEKKKSAACNTA